MLEIHAATASPTLRRIPKMKTTTNQVFLHDKNVLKMATLPS